MWIAVGVNVAMILVVMTCIVTGIFSWVYVIWRSPDAGLVAWIIISFLIVIFLAVLAQKSMYENHLAQRTTFSAFITQLLLSLGFSMLFFIALTAWMAYDGFIFRTKWGGLAWFVSWIIAIGLVFLLLYAINQMPGIPTEYQIHWGFFIAIILSIGIFLGIIYWVMTGKNVPYNQFDSSANVAIIGAGASGSMAAWMFEQSGVSYTVFEKEDYVGGHAFTPHITKINEEDVDVDVDMGYIFGGGYRQMTDLLKAYNVKTLNHSLTYSSHRGDKFFSNNVIPGPEDSLHDEWMRFQKEITGWNSSPRGMNLYRLLPFTIWYRFQGYSDEFFESVLAPGLSLLFISKTSLWHQPAFMVLGMFNNYIFLDPVQRKKESMIWVVERGSQRMYEAFTAGLNIKLSHAVQSIQRDSNGKLTVVTDKGEFEGFTKVIITVGDGMTKLWNPENNRFRWIINQIKFIGCDSYLHSDQSIIPPEVDTDFYLSWNADGGMAYWKDLEFSGKMTKIFEYDTDQDVILTLSPNREIPKEKIYYQKRWYHPTQDFWHLALVLMVLPKFNGMEQVYFAGDWSVDIGHNSALISGIKAACWVGVKEDSDGPMKDLYKTYYTDTCLAEEEVPDDINGKKSARRA